MTIEIKATEIHLVPIDSIHPWDQNTNKHPDSQINALVEQYKFNGMSSPLEVEEGTGDIVSGNGRWLAAKKAGMSQVPVYFRTYESYSHKYARCVAENAIAAWAELDLSAIHANLENLHLPSIDLLGIEGFRFEPVEQNPSDIDSAYTDKIVAPIYEPTGEKPSVKELFSLEKYKELVAEINKSDSPKEIKDFLIYAAQRHIVFNYRNIAEYYAHAPKPVQELMENSALVVIDFKKAIENGFVKLTQDLAEAYDASE